MAVVVGTSTFPQTGFNRTRLKAIQEIADHTGGSDRPDVQRRAADCYDAAVREYNSVQWIFNRMRNEIVLTAPSPAGSADYSLNYDFDRPIAAVLIDAQGNDGGYVDFVPYRLFVEAFAIQTGIGSFPECYTARNVHQFGLITVYPRMGPTVNYPVMRVDYFRRILASTADDEGLNVPVEVEEGIFQLGLAKFVHKIEGASKATQDYRLAAAMRSEVERKHRDFGRR